jgi:hypothetical protein
MSLLKIIIEKKLENYNNYDVKKWYPKAIWQFYQAFCISASFLKLNGRFSMSSKEIKRRNKLYISILSSKKINGFQLKKINNFIKKDMNIITYAIEELNKMEENSASYVVDFNKDDYIGILASEIMR